MEKAAESATKLKFDIQKYKNQNDYLKKTITPDMNVSKLPQNFREV